MEPFAAPRVPPPEKPAADLVLPPVLDLGFEGFGPDAFAVLERLRAHPHVQQYRQEKDAVRAFVMEPFKRYRDDLVVNFVLPNQLGFETEKNVFSRLLKNDFGAGGCHHHLWMSFYRPGRRRLTDYQLAHSLSPDGFTVGLYVGDYAQDLVKQAVRHILDQTPVFLRLLGPLLRDPAWRFFIYTGTGDTRVEVTQADGEAQLKEYLKKARGLWVRTVFPREDVLRWQGALVRHALDATVAAWPLYRFYATGAASPGAAGGR
jgi:hypothetical protein